MQGPLVQTQTTPYFPIKKIQAISSYLNPIPEPQKLENKAAPGPWT